jgi:hypothetical protein
LGTKQQENGTPMLDSSFRKIALRSELLPRPDPSGGLFNPEKYRLSSFFSWSYKDFWESPVIFKSLKRGRIDCPSISPSRFPSFHLVRIEFNAISIQRVKLSMQ